MTVTKQYIRRRLAEMAALATLTTAASLARADEAAPPPLPAPPAGPRRHLEPAIVSATLAATLAALADDEPPLAELRAAATAMVMAEPQRARSLLSRAGLAGWLPELRVRVDRRFGRDESLDYGRTALDSAALVGLDTRDDAQYEVRATWDLSRIVFNPDELGAHAEALRLADLRREVETMVIRLVFERRRLKAEAATSDSGDAAFRLRRELRVQEIEAELDALTGGAFASPRTNRSRHAAVSQTKP